METIASSKVRSNFSQTLDLASSEPVIIERRGQNNLVLLDANLYEQLIAASEEIEDIKLFDEAMAEDGQNVPWDQVLTDLGWA